MFLQTLDTDSSSESSESESSTEEVDSIIFSTLTREGKIKKILKSLDRKQFYQQWHQTVLSLKNIFIGKVHVECYNKQETPGPPSWMALQRDLSWEGSNGWHWRYSQECYLQARQVRKGYHQLGGRFLQCCYQIYSLRNLSVPKERGYF